MSAAWRCSLCLKHCLPSGKKETTTAQIEIGLTLHKMLALLAHQQLSGDESRSNRTMIKQIADYIRAHYAEPINLDMLLAQIPVSKSWFFAAFPAIYGHNTV